MYLATQPDTAKKCAICHLQWVYPFYKENRDADLARRPAEEVVADVDMCFSCHDGSVSDARDYLYSGTGHHKGVRPSEDVTVPEDFPLDESGVMTCATCHTPHALPSEPGKDIDVFLRASNIDSALCRTCHPSYSTGPEQGNHPTGVSVTQSALRTTAAAGSRYAQDNSRNIICETCHSAHGRLSSPQLTLHDAPPERNRFLCSVCHSNRSREANNHPLTGPSSDMTLPEQWPSGDRLCRAESGQIVCRTCHRPHGAPTKRALLQQNNTNSQMCRSCHTEQIPVFDTPHNLKRSAPDTANSLKRIPARSGPCSACHIPHDSTGPYLWARSEPVVPSLDNYCVSCHRKNACGHSVIAEVPSHPVGVGVSRTITGLPLYTDTGHVSTNGTIRCITCHDAHNAAQVPPAPGSGRACSFMRLPHHPDSRLCSVCHDDKFTISHTPHDFRRTGPQLQKAVLKDRVVPGMCGFCHGAHGTDRKAFLWTAPYAASIPARWSRNSEQCTSGYCTGCHDDKNIISSGLPAYGLHPPAFAVRQPEVIRELFRNRTDERFRELSKSESCLIGCSTCHDPHRWGKLSQSAAGPAVSGTAADSFLRHDTAASVCALCHGPDGLFKYTYYHSALSRKKPENLFPFEKQPEPVK